ncbi:flippase [Catalinimonas sp. 4WD22]|uniref:flippase n=1 Tax=Catalinimonas locisalis TaxID=3133978 RepID=UPI003100FB49
MITLKEKAGNLFNSKGFRKYFTNTSWLLLEKLFNLGVAFFVGVYVARFLGPERYGMLSFAQSIIGFLSVFASLGIKNIMTRNLVREADNYPVLMGTAFTIRVVASALGIIMIYGLSPFITEDDTSRVLLIILAFTTLLQSFDVIKSYFQSQVLAKKIVPVAVFQTVVGAIIKIMLIQLNAALVWFAAVYVVELTVSAIGLIIVFRKQKKIVSNWSFRLSYAKKLLKDSWPLLFSGFVVAVYMKIDQVMIKYMLDDAAVGIYAVAIKFTSIWYFVGGIICSSLMPAVIQAKERNQELYENRLQNLYELMVGVGVLIALPMSIVAYPLTNFLYGIEYSAASGVMIIHVWSLIFVFLGTASGNWLLAENLQKYKMSRTILGAVVNVGLNFLLIPNFGVEGAAVATFLSQMTASYLGYLLSKETHVAFIMQSKALVFSSTFKYLRQRSAN